MTVTLLLCLQIQSEMYLFFNLDELNAISIQTNVPQPEAAIDSTECQHRLLEHIQKQQSLAMTRLQTIEARVIGE